MAEVEERTMTKKLQIIMKKLLQHITDGQEEQEEQDKEQEEQEEEEHLGRGRRRKKLNVIYSPGSWI